MQNLIIFINNSDNLLTDFVTFFHTFYIATIDSFRFIEFFVYDYDCLPYLLFVFWWVVLDKILSLQNEAAALNHKEVVEEDRLKQMPKNHLKKRERLEAEYKEDQRKEAVTAEVRARLSFFFFFFFF